MAKDGTGNLVTTGNGLDIKTVFFYFVTVYLMIMRFGMLMRSYEILMIVGLRTCHSTRRRRERHRVN